MDLNSRQSWLICMLSSQLIHYPCKVCSHCHIYVYGRACANEVYLIPQATGIPGSQSSQKNCCCSALLDNLGFKILLFPVTVGLWQRMYAMKADEMRLRNKNPCGLGGYWTNIYVLSSIPRSDRLQNWRTWPKSPDLFPSQWVESGNETRALSTCNGFKVTGDSSPMHGHFP